MGGAKYNMNSSQFDFVKNDIEYSRKGGCFVTTPRAIIYLFITIAVSLFVGVIVYYYGPNSTVTKTTNKPPDIEKLLNHSIESVPKQNIRLPTNVQPFYYRLKLDPLRNESSQNFTLVGEVEILFECLEKTRGIVLNADDLKILKVEAFAIELEEAKRKKRSVDEQATTTEPTETTLPITTEATTIRDIAATTTVSTLDTTNATIILDVKDKEVEITTTPAPVEVSTTIAPNITTTPTTTTMRSIEDYGPKILETTEIKIKDHKDDPLNSKYVIQLQKELQKNKNYSVRITFSTNIAESFQGLYRTSYTHGEQKTWLLATQFQPIYARNVFPCFDEPSFKAPVQITIGRNSNQTILSNAPLIKDEVDTAGITWDYFEPTRPISTYLLGFVVADLKLLATVDVNPKVQIWASKLSEIKVDYAASVLEKMLEYFEQYFEARYPASKVDIVAVRGLPSSSTKSAGLILIKESLFLDASESNEAGKKLLFSVLAKDLASEWLGNLVSIDWWNDFWLVKGMSIFIEEELATNIEKWDSEFTLRVTQPLLHSDDYKSSRNLHQPVENSLQINEVLDDVHHKKGSCLLRMLNNSLAPITFQKGVQLYIRTWQDKSAGVEELWRSIDVAVTEIDKLPKNISVGKIMNTWTEQSGYPLITIVRDPNINGLIINQTKFQTAPNNTDTSLWIIPLNYMVGDEELKIQTLWSSEKSIVVSNITSNFNDTWILFNVGQTGYYRVNYGMSNWYLLINALKTDHTKIPTANRGQLVDDAFELAENGILDYQIPFELAEYLVKERNYIPWSAVLTRFEFIRGVLKSTYVNGAYEDYIVNLVAILFDALGPDDKPEDSTNDIQLRKLIVETACSVNYVNCTKWALQRMKEFMEDGKQISISNRKTVFCTGVKLGNREEWGTLFKRLHEVESSTNVKDLYLALGCSKHQWLINRYLQATLNGSIEWQYVPYVWQSLQQVPGLAFGFKFLRENWMKIYSIYKDKRFILKAIIHDFLTALSTKTDLEDLSLFFQMHQDDLQDFSPLFQGVVDRIKARVEWSEKHLSNIDLWLSSNNYK